MVFSSILFLFTFLPLTLLLYYLSPKKIRNIILLIISLLFYAFGEPIYIFLIILTTLFNYFIALIINKNKDNSKKAKIYFLLAIFINLSLLGFFKYYGFIIDSFNLVFSTNISYTSLPVPIGISFYTFQTLSYLIDLYLNKIPVQKKFLSFSLYVTMFPQIMSGPIVKYKDIYTQIDSREESFDDFGIGIERFIKGLAKKVLLANNIALVWTSISSLEISNLSVLTAWIGIIAFTLQIYFDFSSYSDMAIGVARMFGFTLGENFNYPYISKSVTEFWRRWHISLGSWFREYIYIPLGGNRCSTLKQFRNLFIVWLITGLWHGASFNFILWGLYFGVILTIEKLYLKEKLKLLPSFISNLYTMLVVIIGWVFFSINEFSSAINYLKVMFFCSGNSFIDSRSIYYLYTNLLLFIILFVLCTPFIKNKINILKSKSENLVLTLNLLLLFISVSFLVTESFSTFLYFKF